MRVARSFKGNSARFLALRRRLDVMGYSDYPLGIDTAPLAQQMLEDLVSTTETLKEVEEKINVLEQKLEIAETQIEPLQTENTQLARENNQLHKNLITSSEEAMKLKNQHAARTFELQSENRRLALMNKEATEHVKTLQKNIEEIKKKLQLSIAMPPMMKIPEVIETDPKKMKHSRSASSSRAPSALSNISSNAPSLGFDPNIFSVELENLRKERDKAREDSLTAITKATELEESLKLREEEIARLSEELQKQTGQNGYMVSLKDKCEKQKREIEKMKIQVNASNSEATKLKRIKKKLSITKPKTMVLIEGNVVNESYLSLSEITDVGNTIDNYPSISHSISKLSNSDQSTSKSNNAASTQKTILKSESQTKDQEIEELKHNITTLTQQIEEKNAYIIKLKEELTLKQHIININEEEDNVIDDKKEKANFLAKKEQEKLDQTIAKYEQQLDEKTDEINELKLQIDILTQDVKSKKAQCKNCIILQKQLDQLQKKRVTLSQQDEIQQLRARIAQLESKPPPKSEEKIKEEQDYLAHIADLEEANEKLQRELKDVQEALDEAEQKCYNFPDAELRLRSIVEQLRSEKIVADKEMKQKSSDLKKANERLAESQRINKELQNQLIKAREEATSCREESENFRNKVEEITKKANERNCLVIRDANAAVKHAQKQLTEKTNECEMYQKLLSEARRQLMPLTESTIPEYQAQISKMKRERENLIRKVKRISQIALFAERADASQFSNAVQQLQNELRSFTE